MMSSVLSAQSRREVLRNTLGLCAGSSFLAVQSRLASAQTPELGSWSAIHAWPQIAVHLHVLPTGKIFTFTDNKTAPGEISQAHVVDIPPGGDPSTTWYHPLAAANLFCAGHAYTREGRLMVV